jgi:hypothetical protein
MHWITILLVLQLTCFGQPFRPSSGVLSRTSALVHFMQLWPFATRSSKPTPGSKRPQLHKMYQSRCTAKNSWWWAERLPETCRVVIPIKLEFSASVGFIHKVFWLDLSGSEPESVNDVVEKVRYFQFLIKCWDIFGPYERLCSEERLWYRDNGRSVGGTVDTNVL